MTRRRLLGLALWASATAAATLVSFAIVSAVTSHVITADLSTPAAAAAGVAAPAVGTSDVALEATTATAVESTSTISAANQASPTSTTPPTTSATAPASTPQTTTTPARSRPSSRTSTFSVRGGIVTATCAGRDVRLDSATPAERYRVDVRDDGPDRVEVIFRGDSDGTHVEVRCENGEPVARVDPLDGGGGGPADGSFDGHR